MTKPWKNLEQRTANEVPGGRRTSAAGKHRPDVVGNWLVVECKQRATVPQWIKDALNQATKFARPEGKLGIVRLHEKRKRDSYVIMSWNDFREWFYTKEEKDEL